MRIGISWSIAGALAAVALVGAPAFAAERVTANVPFDFIVGSTVLPAGNYTVEEASSSNGNVLEIISADARHAAYTITIAATSPLKDQTDLVFDKLGDRYFLAKVETDDGVAKTIPLTTAHMEKELVRIQAFSSTTAHGF
ncbi:MAG TPA: hypothetical protein VH583_02775 [Vicinamibacterales bacterium]|jgi:hypothetical protein